MAARTKGGSANDRHCWCHTCGIALESAQVWLTRDRWAGVVLQTLAIPIGEGAASHQRAKSVRRFGVYGRLTPQGLASLMLLQVPSDGSPLRLLFDPCPLSLG